MSANFGQIYDRLNQGTQYTPLSVNTFGDWSLEAGDVVTVEKDGVSYSTPVMQSVVRWNGACMVEVESTGNKERETLSRQSKRAYNSGSGGSGGYYNSRKANTRIAQNAEAIQLEAWATNSAMEEMRSSITITAQGIRSDVSAANSQLYSYVDQTATHWHNEIVDTKSDLHSEILMTSTQIYLAIGKKSDNFYQNVDPRQQRPEGTEVTEGSIWFHTTGIRTYDQAGEFSWEYLTSLEYRELYGGTIEVFHNGGWQEIGGDQLQNINYAHITETEDSITLLVNNLGGDFAGFRVTAAQIESRVRNVEQGLDSTIQQTASMIRSAVWTANSEMYSEIMQTQSMIRSTVANTESNMMTVILQTSSSITQQVSFKSTIYKSYSDPANDTDIRARLKSGDIWVQMIPYDYASYQAMASGNVTYAELSVYQWKEFYGSIIKIWDEDTETWRVATDEQLEKYEYNVSLQTDEETRQRIGDLTNNYSEFLRTKSMIQGTIRDNQNDLLSRIRQTASELRSDYYAANSALHSEILQTATNIRLEVENHITSVQSRIEVESNRISLVVEGTGTNAHIKPAQIVASINNGSSSIQISADHIKLDGNVDLNSVLKVTDGAAYFLKPAMFAGSNHSLTINNGKLVAGGGVQISNGQNLIMVKDYLSLSLSYDDFYNMITGASVSGNTLTLTRKTGNPITFSKATQLSGSWSGSVYTVAASPQGNEHKVGLGTSDKDLNLVVSAGLPTLATNTKYVNLPIYVQEFKNEAYTTKYTTTPAINCAAVYAAGWNAARAKISRSGNTIKIPKEMSSNGTDPGTEDGYTATLNMGSPGAYSQYRINTPGGTGSWTGKKAYNTIGEYSLGNNMTLQYRATDGYYRTDPSISWS